MMARKLENDMKKTFGLIVAFVLTLVSLVTAYAEAATNTPLEIALNMFTKKYADNDSNKIEIQNVYMLTAQDGAALNDDARKLFTNSDTQDDSYDALIYIIARQYSYDFPIPYIMTAGYIAKADGACARQDVQYIFPSDADWQTGKYAGVDITDVTEEALAYCAALDEAK